MTYFRPEPRRQSSNDAALAEFQKLCAKLRAEHRQLPDQDKLDVEFERCAARANPEFHRQLLRTKVQTMPRKKQPNALHRQLAAEFSADGRDFSAEDVAIGDIFSPRDAERTVTAMENLIDDLLTSRRLWQEIMLGAIGLRRDFAAAERLEHTRHEARQILARIPRPVWRWLETDAGRLALSDGALHSFEHGEGATVRTARDFAFVNPDDAKRMKAFAACHRRGEFRPVAGRLDDRRVALQVRDAQNRVLGHLSKIIAGGREPQRGQVPIAWHGRHCHIHKPIRKISDGPRHI